MNAPKTLTEAREQLEAANIQLAQLQSRVAAYENDEVLNALGVNRTTDENGVNHFTNPRLAEAESQLTVARLANAEQAATNNALAAQLAERDSGLSVAQNRIAELEQSQVTVETRAREMVASLGGRPLPIGNDETVLASAAELRTQMNAEKDPNKRFKLYQDLKASQANNGSHLNGKSK